MEGENNQQQPGSETTPAQPAQQVVTPPVSPGNTIDWEARYNNSQRALNDKQTRIQQLEGQVTTLGSQYESQIVELKTGLTTAQQAAQDAQAKAQAAESTLTTTTHKLEVTTLLSTKFQNLAELNAEGLLRTDGLQGEALETYLGGLSAKYAKVAPLAAEQVPPGRDLRGATPPTSVSPTTPAASQSDLQAKMTEMSRTKGVNSPEYTALLNQYINNL